MKKLPLACLLVVTGTSVVSCTDGPLEPLCTQELRMGLSIYVRDSVSGQGLASGSTVVVRDGSFVDSLTATFAGSPAEGPFSSAPERAGTYTVTVRRSGYQAWSKSGIVVTKGICHVDHTDVNARLTP